jgi:hypothetical protein
MMSRELEGQGDRRVLVERRKQGSTEEGNRERKRGEGEGKLRDIPSSLPNTLLTAPEHPPQLMETLNL